MSKYTRIQVASIIHKTGLMPLFYNSDINIAKNVLKACYDGGARILEFTNRGDFAFEIFNELKKYSLDQLPGMILGVGSVTDAGSASYYIQMGADFIVTPVLRKDIALICNRRKILWSAGCGSLSEICKAEELGCEIIKLFPGETYGPKFIKAIKGPQPWTSIMPTGGVTVEEENLKEWFNSGAICVGIGSNLITKDIIESKNYGKLSKTINETLLIINRIKNNF